MAAKILGKTKKFTCLVFPEVPLLDVIVLPGLVACEPEGEEADAECLETNHEAFMKSSPAERKWMIK